MNRKFVFISIAAFAVFTAQACTTVPSDNKPSSKSAEPSTPVVEQTKSPDNRDFSPKDFQANAAAQKGLILDVRTPQEFASGHIEGAVNIDWYNPEFKSEVAKLDKTKPVFVYCAVGGRSGQAKKMLNSEGFKEVHNLNGGIEAWKKEGMKVIK